MYEVETETPLFRTNYPTGTHTRNTLSPPSAQRVNTRAVADTKATETTSSSALGPAFWAVVFRGFPRWFPQETCPCT